MGMYFLVGLLALDLLVVLYLLIIFKKILKRAIKPEVITRRERPKPEGLIGPKERRDDNGL